MPETTPLIKAALNLRVGVGFDVYHQTVEGVDNKRREAIASLRLLSLRKRLEFHPLA